MHLYSALDLVQKESVFTLLKPSSPENAILTWLQQVLQTPSVAFWVQQHSTFIRFSISPGVTFKGLDEL